jgi:phospholipid transport system substrate-binding protein
VKIRTSPATEPTRGALRARALPALLAGLLTAALPALLPMRAAAQTAAPSEDPANVMKELFARLFAALAQERRAGAVSAARASELANEILAPRFDADYTARLVLGAQWRGASEAQRQRFARALYLKLLRTYADSLAEWTPERLRILPLPEDAAATQVTVRTQVARANGTPAAVDYRLRRGDAAWKIFDVIVDGVSYARTWHDDVAAEVEQQGLDAAIARLEKAPEKAAGPAR